MTIAIAASTIVQLAFEAMEMSPPSSFGDDSDQAQSASLHYDTALAICLEAQDWSFASAMATLPPVAVHAPADPDLPHAFALPANCHVLRDVMAAGGRWRADKGILRSDQAGGLTIRYTARISDETALPATFRAAVGLQLAVLMAPRFVEVQGKIDRLEARLSEAMARAARTDARTSSAGSWRDDDAPDWIAEARR